MLWPIFRYTYHHGHVLPAGFIIQSTEACVLSLNSIYTDRVISRDRSEGDVLFMCSLCYLTQVVFRQVDKNLDTNLLKRMKKLHRS